MMIFLAFAAGCVVGGSVGLFVFSLCQVSAKADDTAATQLSINHLRQEFNRHHNGMENATEETKINLDYPYGFSPLKEVVPVLGAYLIDTRRRKNRR